MYLCQHIGSNTHLSHLDVNKQEPVVSTVGSTKLNHGKQEEAVRLWLISYRPQRSPPPRQSLLGKSFGKQSVVCAERYR